MKFTTETETSVCDIDSPAFVQESITRAVTDHELSAFASDVKRGLSAANKHLSSRYFYDDRGSAIFQDIMKMPEYYPTACEFEILSLQSSEIIASLAFEGPFQIVEFGAGDGVKTRQLLKQLMQERRAFSYVPIDISAKAIDDLVKNMQTNLPGIDIQPRIGDYFEVMQSLAEEDVPCLFLFLGSNIGNYTNQDALDLLAKFYTHMKSGDKLLTGFDLQKHPGVIRDAYNDAQGITREFNLNLLRRMNRELSANFQIDQFDFYSHYDPTNGEVRSYLVSLKPQSVDIKAVDETFQFERNELIWTELSKKYRIQDIEQMALETAFGVVRHFIDCKHYFADSLWQK